MLLLLLLLLDNGACLCGAAPPSTKFNSGSVAAGGHNATVALSLQMIKILPQEVLTVQYKYRLKVLVFLKHKVSYIGLPPSLRHT